ncbi:MAG: AsmA family protein [bacterium]
MKRLLKIALITLTSLLLLVIISVSIAMWLIFTPERLTPIVRNQTEKHIPYQTEVGEVDLTFFSTFPQFGIKLDKFTIISPAKGAVSDTLMTMEQLTGVIDAKKYWKNRDVIISELILTNGSVNVFADSLGDFNYSLFVSETSTESEEADESGFSFINLDNIEFNDINLSYNDLSSGIDAAINNFRAKVSGNLKEDKLNVILNVDNANVSFRNKGEKYLEHAILKLSIPAKISLSQQIVEMEEAFLSINDLGVSISGSLENDLMNDNIITDINYVLDSWKIEDAMALVPLKYISGTGVNSISGLVSSKGTIKGIYNDSLMPLIDISLSLQNGNLSYTELPFPLSKMKGDIHFYGDMNNDDLSWLRIDHFEARSPRSGFQTRGMVNQIFADMHFDLITQADAFIDEFAVFLPEDMDVDLNGRINGQIETDFLLSQLTNMELDKVKISGLTSLYDFRMDYDSLSVYTNYSRLSFSVPNDKALKPNTSFASVRIESDKLFASQIAGFYTDVNNSNIYLEMSDVRDTTRIPDLFCMYRIDSLRAGMDTINLSMVKPYGNFSVFPVKDSPGQPSIEIAYSTFDLKANAGDNSVEIEDIMLNTSVINDTTQEDIFMQWLARGSLDMKNGAISVTTLSEPVGIPFIKMVFNPETFNIHESRINIDRSDYELKGTVNNILSYFRGDSILRADFDFLSNSTDLNQLMYLTSGIGVEEEEDDTAFAGVDEEDSFSGPYMVPEGVDVMLKAKVNQLISGPDTAINIMGDVLINDGILVLDDLTFTTPAADMQLTAMYRTARKNHLYMGIDYHMLDVEIGRLLEMIPDIDTLMPMLRSFAGSGEFHIAAETYMDSAYNIKKSTLRGASSIVGQDLVLMDGETFGEIAKKLRFSRKAENRVDSLSAEFTIFREEIDIYPFLIVMDRYKAVVGGRHNLDMSFNYHVSLVDSPLPVRLGIDIKGTLDDLQYRPTSIKYAEFYRPARRRVVESRQLELRRMIREALIHKEENTEQKDSGETEL